MASCRHNPCDSKTRALTCGNEHCDGISAAHECRHKRPQTPSAEAQSKCLRDAVTRPEEASRSPRVEISSQEIDLTIRFPTERPVLTQRAARVLLGILVGLAEAPVLDRLEGGESDDS